MTNKFLDNFDKEFEELPIAHSDACADSPMKECNLNCPYLVVKSFFLSRLQKLQEEVKNCVPKEETTYASSKRRISIEFFLRGFNSAIQQMKNNLVKLFEKIE